MYPKSGDPSVTLKEETMLFNNVVCWCAFPSWIPQFGAPQQYVEVNPMKG